MPFLLLLFLLLQASETFSSPTPKYIDADHDEQHRQHDQYLIVQKDPELPELPKEFLTGVHPTCQHVWFEANVHLEWAKDEWIVEAYGGCATIVDGFCRGTPPMDGINITAMPQLDVWYFQRSARGIFVLFGPTLAQKPFCTPEDDFHTARLMEAACDRLHRIMHRRDARARISPPIALPRVLADLEAPAPIPRTFDKKYRLQNRFYHFELAGNKVRSAHNWLLPTSNELHNCTILPADYGHVYCKRKTANQEAQHIEHTAMLAFYEHGQFHVSGFNYIR